ncbi:MAG TPA: helix-turn-helix domain-containing protein [Chloroflexota bacterium]|jgi:hypothetical protein|nr:helix-turn-helix domain-containing protein [Chloroflexota bacterium]
MANTSNGSIVAFRGTRRELTPTHTYAGALYSPVTQEDTNLLARKVVARLRALDPQALKYLAADLVHAEPSPIEDPLVTVVAGRAEQAAMPGGDRHTAFLVQQYALRQQLRRQSISAEQAAKLLDVSRQTVHNQVRQDKLLAFRDGDRLRLPAWQFDATSAAGVVAGLSAVLAALHAAPMARVRWFALPQPALGGRTPADALRTGEMEAVVRAAARVGLR